MRARARPSELFDKLAMPALSQWFASLALNISQSKANRRALESQSQVFLQERGLREFARIGGQSLLVKDGQAATFEVNQSVLLQSCEGE